MHCYIPSATEADFLQVLFKRPHMGFARTLQSRFSLNALIWDLQGPYKKVGFGRLRLRQGLILGPSQGLPTCLTPSHAGLRPTGSRMVSASIKIPYHRVTVYTV